MPKTLQLSVPPPRTQELLQHIETHAGVLGLQVHRGVSLKPPGDLITVHLLNRSLPGLLRELKERKVALDGSTSLLTEEIASIVSIPASDEIAADVSEGTWEEMEWMIGKESNMTLNALLLMLGAGLIASLGIVTGALHLVIGAMVIAPGFEPIIRVTLALAAGTPGWRRGAIDTLKGYVFLFAGALLGVWINRALPSSPASSYVEPAALMAYWSSFAPSSLILSALAGALGALLIITNRSVLTGGVMIALALIPTLSLGAIGLGVGDMALAGKSLARWLLEVFLVLAASFPVFLWKRCRVQRRSMWW